MPIETCQGQSLPLNTDPWLVVPEESDLGSDSDWITIEEQSTDKSIKPQYLAGLDALETLESYVQHKKCLAESVVSELEDLTAALKNPNGSSKKRVIKANKNSKLPLVIDRYANFVFCSVVSESTLPEFLNDRILSHLDTNELPREITAAARAMHKITSKQDSAHIDLPSNKKKFSSVKLNTQAAAKLQLTFSQNIASMTELIKQAKIVKTCLHSLTKI